MVSFILSSSLFWGNKAVAIVGVDIDGVVFNDVLSFRQPFPIADVRTTVRTHGNNEMREHR